jgi:hypothetical protein
MGDAVFAPFYEVLKRRGVRFQFFHRVEQVRLAPAERLGKGERPYVEAIEVDVQAEVKAGEYQPLVDVRGIPSGRPSPTGASSRAARSCAARSSASSRTGIVARPAARPCGWASTSIWRCWRWARARCRTSAAI